MSDTASIASSLYERLPEGAIRLLELEGTCLTGKEGDKSRDLAIQCRLRTVAADELPENPYAALSYVWGPRRVRRYLFCNGHLVKITSNLYDALWQMIYGSTSFSWSLWVDAICINQDDDDDKNQQVAQMHRIYSGAARVLVWLGKLATTEDDKALVGFWKFLETASLTEVDSEAWELYKKGPEYQRGRQLLSTCDWFHRAWTFQEIVLARDALVLCDTFVTSWETMAEVCSDSFEIEAIESKRRRLKGSPADDGELLQLLASMASRQATDPRDEIYAVLGIYTGRFAFTPDYSKDLIWACSQAASIIGSEHMNLGYLDVLAQSHFPSLSLYDPHIYQHCSGWVSKFLRWPRVDWKDSTYAYRLACLSPRSCIPDWTALDRKTLLSMNRKRNWNFDPNEQQLSPVYDHDNARLSVKGAIMALFTALEPTFGPDGKAVAFIQRTPPCIFARKGPSFAKFSLPKIRWSHDAVDDIEIGGEKVYRMLQTHSDGTCSCEAISSVAALKSYHEGAIPREKAARSFYSGFLCKVYGSTSNWLLLPHYNQRKNGLVYSILGTCLSQQKVVNNVWEHWTSIGVEGASNPIFTRFELAGNLDNEPWPHRNDIGNLCCTKSTALAVEQFFERGRSRKAHS